MKLKMHLGFITILTLSLAALNIAHANGIEHITIVNNSDVVLMPTAEGLNDGCLGGSLPPFFDPIAPHSTRNVDILFIEYASYCRFDVLPQPNIITYLQACHAVKANDTVIFSGKDFMSLHCQIGV
jgi:hypothetical protein